MGSHILHDDERLKTSQSLHDDEIVKKDDEIVELKASNTALSKTIQNKDSEYATIQDELSDAYKNVEDVEKEFEEYKAQIVALEQITPKDFTKRYKALYGEIVDGTKDTAFYKEMIKNINDSFANYTITDEEKIQLLTNSMIGIVNGVTQNAMSTALQVLDKEIKISLELKTLWAESDLKTAQIKVQKNQAKVMLADEVYKKTQEKTLRESVTDNRLIKSLDSQSEMIGTIGAGGLVPSETMFKNFYKLNNLLLLNSDINLSEDVSVSK